MISEIEQKLDAAVKENVADSQAETSSELKSDDTEKAGASKPERDTAEVDTVKDTLEEKADSDGTKDRTIQESADKIEYKEENLEILKRNIELKKKILELTSLQNESKQDQNWMSYLRCGHDGILLRCCLC